LIDLGSSAFQGIAFAVSARTAKPLLAAWQAAPQPERLASCGRAHPPAKRGPRVGVPLVYSGPFTAVDRLERCVVSVSAVSCTAGPSGKGVRLDVGARA